MTMVSKQDSSERWSLVEHPFQLSRLERQDNISVTSVALPLTDQEHPSYFICGRNSGSLSLHKIPGAESNGSSKEDTKISFNEQEDRVFASAVNDICFSGDALRTAVAFEDGSIRVLDTGTLREIDRISDSLDGAITSCCYSPQSNLLVAGSYEGLIHVYDARNARKMIRRLFPAHGCPVTSMSFHLDGTVFMSTGLDGIARVWDVAGPCLASLVGSSERGIGSGTFSPNGQYALLGALNDGALGLWDLAHSGRLKRVRKYPRQNTRYWMRAAFLENGHIVGGCEDGRLCLWNSDTTTVVSEFDCKTKGITVPLACATSKSFIVCGGIGLPVPCLMKLMDESR